MNDIHQNVDLGYIRTAISGFLKSGVLFTDILFRSGAPILVKTPGGWTPLTSDPPSDDDIEAYLLALSSDWEAQLSEGAMSVAIENEGHRLRSIAYMVNGGMTKEVCVRVIRNQDANLLDLGLPPVITELVSQPRGLILFSGPTGSGKSTSMSAFLQQINKEKNCHIVTIEDPIEWFFTNEKSVFTQREVGADVVSYSEGVREAMRQRPDVVMIGEIRDRDVAEAAMICAESGHLVLAGIHANSAPTSVQKLLSFFPDEEAKSRLLALQSSLVGVVNQLLLPSQDQSEYVLAAEVLLAQKAGIQEALGDHHRLRSIMKDQKSMHVTMTDSLASLVMSNRISRERAYVAAGNDAQELKSKIQVAG